jgi:hypothetical protein
MASGSPLAHCILGVILLFSVTKIWIEHTHLLRPVVVLRPPAQRSSQNVLLLLTPPPPHSRVQMSHQQGVTASATTTTRNKTATTAKNSWWKDSPDHNSKLPTWMKEYFAWHQESLRQLHDGTADAESFQYFVLRCLQRNKKCSGASDRLRTIPTALLLAHESHRLLFIVWDKPAALEEFLVPPPLGGLDWRLPVAIEEKIHVRDVNGTFLLTDDTGRGLPNVTDRVVCMKSARGEQYYNDHHHHEYLEESSRKKKDLDDLFSYDQVFPHVWNIFFQPSPAVQAQIDAQFQILQLQPGQYVSAHVRALYQSNAVEQHEEINAIHCASQLAAAAAAAGVSDGSSSSSMLPIYFASDSNRTVAFAREYGKSKGGGSVHVVARASDHEPLHLDRGRDFLTKAADEWQNHAVSDFYDIFVDLYILSMARCVTHGIGGYGKLAVLLSRNQTCSIDHRKTTCDWPAATTD